MSAKAQKRNKQNKLIYAILNITENTKEKECITADKKNEKKYRETIEKLGVTSKEWENTGVMLNLEIPTPPSPSNYERLLEYRRTHVLRPAILQSEATIFLQEKGYKLGVDYQAYQAIEIVNKLQEYEKECALPDILASTNQKEDSMIDLEVLNLSRDTEKKRHSICALPKNSPGSTSLKSRHLCSFNYSSSKRNNKKDTRKIHSAGDERKYQERGINSQNFSPSVGQIVNKMNHEENIGKPKSRFNTVRKKSFKSSSKQPSSGVFLNPIHNFDNIKAQTARYSNHPSFEVQPSAPPMPPDYEREFINYENENNSASSVDSLFDTEEMKQFDRRYHTSQNSREQEYRNNQKKYNSIYPNLSHQKYNEDDDDVCSV